MDMFRTNTFHLPLAVALVKGGKQRVHPPKWILREALFRRYQEPAEAKLFLE